MLNRLIGVVTLRARIFQQIVSDGSATGQAAVVVVVVALLVSVSAYAVRDSAAIVGAVAPRANGPSAGLAGIAFVSILLGWAIGSWFLAFMAKVVFKGRANTLGMLRLFGFVQLFWLLGAIPIPNLGLILSGAALMLSFVATVLGVKSSTRLDFPRSLATAVVGFVVFTLISFLIGGVASALGLLRATA